MRFMEPSIRVSVLAKFRQSSMALRLLGAPPRHGPSALSRGGPGPDTGHRVRLRNDPPRATRQSGRAEADAAVLVTAGAGLPTTAIGRGHHDHGADTDPRRHGVRGRSHCDADADSDA